jgi:NADH dehydrogenase (ubiquinone) Fe-S protein 6
MPIPPPETTTVTSPSVVCDGATATDPALGHPRVYLRIDEKGFVECGYCDRRFILKGGPADVPASGSSEANQTVTG